MNITNHDQMLVKRLPHAANVTLKTILFYTPFFDLPNYGFGGGQKPFVKNCQVKNCQGVSKRDYFEDMGDFDAVMFHLPNLLHPGNKIHENCNLNHMNAVGFSPF